MDAAQRISEAAETIRSALLTAQEEGQTAAEALAGMQGDIATAQAELDQLNEAIRDAKTDLKTQSEANTRALEAQNALLSETQDKVEKAKKQLADTLEKHKQFMDYKLRAERALKTQEESLQKREDSLEKTIALARRRTGILSTIEQ